MYDDAVELQQFYVQQRDRVCKDGERFVSPAISQTKRHLQHELDEERKRKAKEETSDVMEVDLPKDEVKNDGEVLSIYSISPSPSHLFLLPSQYLV